jgi:DnaJ-domain-containing protein 1
MEPTPTSGQSTLRHAIARLVAAMMVADRRLSMQEIDAAARLDYIGLGPLSPLVREELQRATRMPIDVGDACTALRGTGAALIGTVLAALAGIAASDGAAGDDERRVFAAIATRLGARTVELPDYLEGQESRSAPASAAAPAVARRAAAADDGANALRVLGLGTAANPAEVDAAYLRLVEEYDPMKVAPLGADFVALAIRKLAALTELYATARDAAGR